MNIREKLIKIRDDSKLSQQEFADKLDVTRQTVSRWEAGKSVPSSAQLSKICRVFSLDANALLTEPLPPAAEEREEGAQVNGSEKRFNGKVKAALLIAVCALLLLALAGVITTVIYAVKDAAYDTVATVWVVAIPQNTPMINLSVFLAVFIAVLAVTLIVLLRGRKK